MTNGPSGTTTDQLSASTPEQPSAPATSDPTAATNWLLMGLGVLVLVLLGLTTAIIVSIDDAFVNLPMLLTTGAAKGCELSGA